MPDFDPGKWNDDGNVQYDNNCYDYATDHPSGRTDRTTRSRPGKKAAKEMPKSPYTCDDIMKGVEADVKAANAGEKSDKDKKCNDKCWKVAVMRKASSDGTNTDFHFVRQDSGGSWSHKQGDGPAKNTDDEGKQIESAILSTKSMDLELPEGRVRIVYEKQHDQPQVRATASVFSGEENPYWNLDPSDVEVLKSKLRNLKPTSRRPVYRMGRQGFSVEARWSDVPDHVRVLEGVISLRSGREPAQWFEDVHGLERWLSDEALAQPFSSAVRASLLESVRKRLRKKQRRD